MDASRFDGLTWTLAPQRTRRTVARILGGLVAMPLLGVTPAGAGKKKKKITLCLNGQTVGASKKNKKKLFKRGATAGACPTSPPPPAGCTPQCAGDAVACGAQLKQALLTGGTIVLCPGRYAGNFVMTVGSTLIGAGNGVDPASSTILDAERSGRVLTIADGVTASLSGLRVTRGNRLGGQGGGIFAGTNSDVQVENCVIVDNASDVHGGGVHAGGRLRLSNSTVTGNSASIAGGINLDDAVLQSLGPPSSITNSVIAQNESTRSAGGIHTSTPLTITGSEIRNNTAEKEGGGVRVDGVTVTFDSTSKVINNTAGEEGGGGIFVTATAGGRIIANGVLIDGNTGPECVGVGCPA